MRHVHASTSHPSRQAVADHPDRRLQRRTPSHALKLEINGAQLATLNTLERFGWDLQFIRHAHGKPSLVVLHDPDTRKLAVLDADGELDENPVRQRFRD
jgi:hypothetical protein